MTEERRTFGGYAPNVDWWRVHSDSTEGDPDRGGGRSAREVGGPVAPEDAEETTGAMTGGTQT